MSIRSRGEKQPASQETRTSLVWPVQDFRMLSMMSMLYSLASCLTMRERLSEGLKAVGAVRMFFLEFWWMMLSDCNAKDPSVLYIE